MPASRSALSSSSAWLRHEALARKEQREALWRLFVAGFGAMQVMMYAFPAYIAAEGEMTRDIEQLMRWASLILTLPVLFYSSLPFIRNAWRDLRLRRAGMDVPDAILGRLRGLSREDQARAGLDLACEIGHRIREIEGVRGLHIMAIRATDMIPELVERLILGARLKIPVRKKGAST